MELERQLYSYVQLRTGPETPDLIPSIHIMANNYLLLQF